MYRADISTVEGKLLGRTLENLYRFHNQFIPWSRLLTSESYGELEWRYWAECDWLVKAQRYVTREQARRAGAEPLGLTVDPIWQQKYANETDEQLAEILTQLQTGCMIYDLWCGKFAPMFECMDLCQMLIVMSILEMIVSDVRDFKEQKRAAENKGRAAKIRRVWKRVKIYMEELVNKIRHSQILAIVDLFECL